MLRQRSHLVLLFVATILSLIGCSSPHYAVTGRVTDEADGQPLQGVLLRSGRTRVQTTPDGEFELLLPAGSHDIWVVLPGYVTQTVSAAVSEENPSAYLDISLPRRALRGQVMDAETGAPIAGVELRMGEQRATSGEDGTFVLDAVILGDLQAIGRGYLPAQLAASEIEAFFDEAGNSVGLCQISLQPRILEGIVTDAVGAPLSGVPVTAHSGVVRTDAEGRYRLARVEPGEVIIYGGEKYRPQEITYSASVQDVILQPWHVVVTVRDAYTRAPLEGAAILVGEQNNSTDVAGRAELSILPGTTLAIVLEGFSSQELVYQGEESLEISLKRSRIEGILTDSQSGQPVANGLVQVFENEPEPALIRSGEDGRFVLDDVSEARSVTIKAPGYRRANVEVGDPANVAVPLEPFEFRGVYVPFGLLTVPEKVIEILDLVQETGMNGIVVDVKSDRAYIAWDSENQVAKDIGAYPDWGLMDMRGLIEEAHRRGLYVIGRMVVFKDDVLARAKPEWAVKRPDGSLYLDNEGLAWSDPFLQEVRDYNIALAVEAVGLGLDEIQLDYLRFPSDGAGVLGLVYAEEANFETRTAAMGEFCAQMSEAVARTPAFLSADIFGLTVWLSPEIDMGIGQRLYDVAPHMDYISPMLYPTTFAPGELGYDYPGLYPYEIVYRSVLASKERSSTLVRPWLQYYSIGSYNYGLREWLEQRKAAEDAGSCGWIFWNARGVYEPEPFYGDAIEKHPELPTPPPPEETPTEQNSPDAKP